MSQMTLDLLAAMCPYQVSRWGEKIRYCSAPVTHRAWWAFDEGWAVDADEDESSGPMADSVEMCQAHASELAEGWFAHFHLGGAERRGDEFVNPRVWMEAL